MRSVAYCAHGATRLETMDRSKPPTFDHSRHRMIGGSFGNYSDAPLRQRADAGSGPRLVFFIRLCGLPCHSPSVLFRRVRRSWRGDRMLCRVLGRRRCMLGRLLMGLWGRPLRSRRTWFRGILFRLVRRPWRGGRVRRATTSGRWFARSGRLRADDACAGELGGMRRGGNRGMASVVRRRESREFRTAVAMCAACTAVGGRW